MRQILPRLLGVLLLALMVVVDPATPSAFAAPRLRAYRTTVSLLGDVAAGNAAGRAAAEWAGKFFRGGSIRPPGKVESTLDMDGPGRSGWLFSNPPP
jgi:hypothetical protein